MSKDSTPDPDTEAVALTLWDLRGIGFGPARLPLSKQPSDVQSRITHEAQAAMSTLRQRGWTGPGKPLTVSGLKVTFDPTLPENVAEIRDGKTGELIARTTPEAVGALIFAPYARTGDEE